MTPRPTTACAPCERLAALPSGAEMLAELRLGHDAIAHRVYAVLLQRETTVDMVRLMTDVQLLDLPHFGTAMLDRFRERVSAPVIRRGRLQAAPRKLYPCGTLAAYSRHIKAGEEPCGACRAANTAHNQKGRTKRANRRAADVPHGYGGYINWLCRCKICCAANTEKGRELAANRA